MPKRKVRIQEIERDIVENLVEANSSSLLKAKQDEDLFFIDRGGSKRAKNKIIEIQNKSKQIISKGEKKLFNKILSKVSNEKSESDGQAIKENKICDLWGEGNDLVVNTNRNKKEKETNRVKVKINPGLSYNPSHNDHQNALGEVDNALYIYRQFVFT